MGRDVDEEGEADVHVDWHMTPEEWAQLQEVLLHNQQLPYIQRLVTEGKI
jgi:hypothetical protein